MLRPRSRAYLGERLALVDDLRTAVVAMQGYSERMLQALTTPVTGLTAQVFVGYP